MSKIISLSVVTTEFTEEVDYEVKVSAVWHVFCQAGNYSGILNVGQNTSDTY